MYPWRVGRNFFLVLLVLGLAPVAALAQVPTGAVLGTVLDMKDWRSGMRPSS
jgi:hypothetical protein